MKKLSLFLFFICSFTGYTQKLSEKEQFIRDSVEIMKIKLVRPQFKFDNRLTYYEGQTLSINGLDAGVLLKDKLRLTLGFYRLEDDLSAFRQTIDSIDLGRVIKLNYGTINTEIIYKNARFFSLGMPVEIGFGKTELSYKNYGSDIIYKKQKGLIALAHFGLSATYKPIRWLGLKGIVGYRKSLFSQVKEFQFNGFFTSLGLNIDFREIIKDIRMFNLKKKHRRGNNLGNAVDLITD
jgi:hypothetical protein